MKRITLKELPEIYSEDIFQLLIEMALELPQTREWQEIFDFLIENDYPFLRKILDEVQKRQKAIEQAKEDAKSDEQKERERKEWKEFVKNADPKKFYGNMGEPTTPQEYKNRHGVWPPGYDKNGNKV